MPRAEVWGFLSDFFGGVALAGNADDFFAVVIAAGSWRQGVGREGVGNDVVDSDAIDNLVLVETHKILGGVFAAIFLGENLGVFRAHDEGDDGAAVAKNRFLYFFGNLGDVLIGEDKIEAVFTGF